VFIHKNQETKIRSIILSPTIMMYHLFILVIFPTLSVASNARNQNRAQIVRNKRPSQLSVNADGSETVGYKLNTERINSGISAGIITPSGQDFSHPESVSDTHDPIVVEKMQFDRAEPEGDVSDNGLPMWFFVLCAAGWACWLASGKEKRQMTKDAAKDRANMLMNMAAPLIQEASKVIGISVDAASSLNQRKSTPVNAEDSEIDVNCCVDHAEEYESSKLDPSTKTSRYEEPDLLDVSAGLDSTEDFLSTTPDLMMPPPAETDADLDSMGLMDTEAAL